MNKTIDLQFGQVYYGHRDGPVRINCSPHCVAVAVSGEKFRLIGIREGTCVLRITSDGSDPEWSDNEIVDVTVTDTEVRT